VCSIKLLAVELSLCVKANCAAIKKSTMCLMAKQLAAEDSRSTLQNTLAVAKRLLPKLFWTELEPAVSLALIPILAQSYLTLQSPPRTAGLSMTMLSKFAVYPTMANEETLDAVTLAVV